MAPLEARFCAMLTPIPGKLLDRTGKEIRGMTS